MYRKCPYGHEGVGYSFDIGAFRYHILKDGNFYYQISKCVFECSFYGRGKSQKPYLLVFNAYTRFSNARSPILLSNRVVALDSHS